MDLPTYFLSSAKSIFFKAKAIDSICFAEDEQIYENIKPSDVTTLIMEMISTTDKDMDLDIAVELIDAIHWSFVRRETKRIEKILEFCPYDMLKELLDAKKKTKQTKELRQ